MNTETPKRLLTTPHDGHGQNETCPGCPHETPGGGELTEVDVRAILLNHRQAFTPRRSFHCTGCDWTPTITGDGRNDTGLTIAEQHSGHLATVLAAAVAEARAEVVARVEALQAENDEDRYLPGFHYKAQMIQRVLDELAALAGPNPRGGQDGGGE